LTGGLVFLAFWIGATLVFIEPGERLGFVSLDALIAFLRQQADDETSVVE
jgi:hypothetical protein